MRIAMLAPIAWRTPPRHYGPWENFVSLLTEGLLARGIDVTLFATAESQTKGKLSSVCPKGYEEDPSINPKVWECMHIAEVMEQAGDFDLIHNNFDFLPLSYSRLIKTPIVSTIHGFSSPSILPVYEKYDGHAHYVAISNADRAPGLHYAATIYHGINLAQFTLRKQPEDILLYFGRIHPDKGTKEAIEIARGAGKKLVIAGIIQDQRYYREEVLPHIDDLKVSYVGSVGPKDRDELLGKSLALLHPISFSEPFGLSVIESMACGTPVVAFELGSMSELITSGSDGFLVESPSEAVEALGRISEIDRAACRKTVEERFSVERMVDEYLAVYEKILKYEA